MPAADPKQLYTWCLHKRTGEWHLFKTIKQIKNGEEKCTYQGTKSICKEMETTDVSRCREEMCVNEDEARMDAARNLKRKACGICVSDLYATRD